MCIGECRRRIMLIFYRGSTLSTKIRHQPWHALLTTRPDQSALDQPNSGDEYPFIVTLTNRFPAGHISRGGTEVTVAFSSPPLRLFLSFFSLLCQADRGKRLVRGFFAATPIGGMPLLVACGRSRQPTILSVQGLAVRRRTVPHYETSRRWVNNLVEFPTLIVASIDRTRTKVKKGCRLSSSPSHPQIQSGL